MVIGGSIPLMRSSVVVESPSVPNNSVRACVVNSVPSACLKCFLCVSRSNFFYSRWVADHLHNLAAIAVYPFYAFGVMCWYIEPCDAAAVLWFDYPLEYAEGFF